MWDELPIELRVYILSIRNTYRNNNAIIIQKKWQKYIAPSIAAIDIVLELEVDENCYILTRWKSTAEILEYCAKILTAKINKDFWNFILKEIRIGLNIDEIYVIETKFLDDPSIAYYYITENAYFTLYNKFKN